MEKQRTNFQLPDDPARPSILMRQMLPPSFSGSSCVAVSVLIPDFRAVYHPHNDSISISGRHFLFF